MAYLFAKPNEGSPLATISNSGMLGFNPAASRMMNMAYHKYWRVGMSDEGDGRIYLWKSSPEDAMSFLLLYGDIHYLPVEAFLNSMGYNTAIGANGSSVGITFSITYDPSDGHYCLSPN